MNEAFTYATTTDPAATAGVETPQLSASSGSGTPFGVNQFLSAYTTTTQSITVNTPTAEYCMDPGSADNHMDSGKSADGNQCGC